MTTTWQEEARGIEPWPGCALLGGGRVTDAWVTGGDGSKTLRASVGARNHLRAATDCIPDLSDPDTLAAFDRRLALRLGAPEDAVREGVTVGWWAERQAVVVTAGRPRCPIRWMQDFPAVPNDPGHVLARVRAWWSVP